MSFRSFRNCHSGGNFLQVKKNIQVKPNVIRALPQLSFRRKLFIGEEEYSSHVKCQSEIKDFITIEIICKLPKSFLLNDSLSALSFRTIIEGINNNEMKDYNFFVYITCNPGKTTFYSGVTNDLERRMKEHYENRGNSKTFAGKYFCYKLIYYERHSDINIAIEREKEIKDLSREKKLELIKSLNPDLNFYAIKFTLKT